MTRYPGGRRWPSRRRGRVEGHEVPAEEGVLVSRAADELVRSKRCHREPRRAAADDEQARRGVEHGELGRGSLLARGG